MRFVTKARMDEAVGAAGKIVSAALNGDESAREDIGLSRREVAAFGFGIMTGAEYVSGDAPRAELGANGLAHAALATLITMLNDRLSYLGDEDAGEVE